MKNKVVGSILSYFLFDELQISYWIGRTYWGRGGATKAIELFLQIQTHRPIFARAVIDNFRSIRVLEKSRFIKIGQELYFSNARGKGIEEVIYKLNDDFR